MNNYALQYQLRKLPEEFRLNGWAYEQIIRRNDICIYSQTRQKDGAPYATIEYYEVIRVQHRKAKKTPKTGTLIPEGEYYPKTSQWGIHGWTYSTYEKALAKFNALLSEKAKAKESKMYSMIAK